MRGVGGVKKSIHQSWLAKGLGLGLLCWGFKGVQDEIPSVEASTLHIGSVTFPPVAFPPVHNSILVTDYLTKMGIKTVIIVHEFSALDMNTWYKYANKSAGKNPLGIMTIITDSIWTTMCTLGKRMNLFTHHYCPTKMALELNNPQRLTCC